MSPLKNIAKHFVLNKPFCFHTTLINLYRDHLKNKKVKVVPYTFVRRGVPAREDTYPGHRHVRFLSSPPLSLSVATRYPFVAG